jgi:hypothetical protein
MRAARPPLLLKTEHEFEPQPGLPERLPAGETILWQGAPDPWQLTVRALHWRKLAIYFALLLLGRAGGAVGEGTALADALRGLGPLALAFGVALAIVGTLGWLAASTTAYTLTDERVVMRIGIVLSVSFNLPLTRIEAAHCRPRAGGLGDIALAIEPATRIGWLHLWPHVRPWQLRRPQPMLRCVPDVERVAALLATAWGQANAAVVRPASAPDEPAAQPAGAPRLATS